MTQRVSDEHVQKILLDARAEIASLRAALKRCHALLETARDHWAYDDQVEEWRNLVLAELSPCDESGSCPPERRGRGSHDPR